MCDPTASGEQTRRANHLVRRAPASQKGNHDAGTQMMSRKQSKSPRLSFIKISSDSDAASNLPKRNVHCVAVVYANNIYLCLYLQYSSVYRIRVQVHPWSTTLHPSIHRLSTSCRIMHAVDINVNLMLTSFRTLHK